MAFRGRCPSKMLIPNKPAKYGIKIVMLCDNKSKYMQNAEDYLGKGTNTKGLGLAEYFIMNLATPIFGSNRNGTMDNWFTSIPVAKKLLQTPHETTIVGTLRKNKLEIPSEMLEVRKENSEKAKFCFDDKLTMLSYQSRPHKNVILLSTMHSRTNFISNKPEMIQFYNSTKGGVDAFDHMSAQMSRSRKTRRWPLCVFYGMLNTTIINSWIVYKEKSANDCERQKLALALANELGKEWMKKRLRNPSLPTIVKEEIKLILDEPQPICSKKLQENKIEKQTGCRKCVGQNKNRKTKILCYECKTPVCIEHKISLCFECAKNL